jgi:hypothetical protein
MPAEADIRLLGPLEFTTAGGDCWSLSAVDPPTTMLRMVPLPRRFAAREDESVDHRGSLILPCEAPAKRGRGTVRRTVVGAAECVERRILSQLAVDPCFRGGDNIGRRSAPRDRTYGRRA